MRHNSSAPGLPSDLPAGYIPDKPPVPLPDPDFTSQIELNALGEPTLQSLGLGSNAPSGLFQQALEYLHVSLDCPWWVAIVITTVCLRMCMFPLMIKARKNTINMTNNMPTIQRLQTRIREAKMTGNQHETMRAYVKYQEFNKTHNIKAGRMMLLPAIQIPIFVSVFWGMRGMANLPMETMKTGGALWFLDLTIPDPFYALPVMTAATLLLTVELGVDSMQASNMSHVQKWMFRIMPIVLVPVMINFPTALLVYWFTSNSFSLCQAMILKIPAVKKVCGIPELLPADKRKSEKKPFMKGFKDSWEEQKTIARMKDRERVERQQWENSGKGPLVKTYKYNPVERKQRT